MWAPHAQGWDKLRGSTWMEELCLGDVDEESDCEQGEHGGENPIRLREEDSIVVPKRMLDPRLPSQEEVDRHNLTHLPYRNWCPICVKAKGKDMDHRKAVEKVRGLSEYCFDYCFPGDEFGFKWTVLVGKERISGLLFATTVPTKGSSGKFSVDKSLDFLEEAGDMNNSIILKNDQGPATQYFIKDSVDSRPEAKVILEESPVKSSGSNEIVERGVQSI